MKIFSTLIILFLSLSLLAQSPLSQQSFQSSHKAGFVVNRGQLVDQEGVPNHSVRYLLKLSNLNVQLRTNGFSYDTYVRVGPQKARRKHDPRNVEAESVSYKFHRVDVEFLGANPNPQFINESLLPGQLNYYSKAGALTSSVSYERVTYRDLYPGIDLVFKVNQPCIEDEPQVEYDFVVHPGADPSVIKLQFDGQNDMKLKNQKTLSLALQHGEFTESIPLSFEAETQNAIPVSYQLDNEGEVSFHVASYDKCQTLIIDPTPTLLWGTYFGGSLEDSAYAVAQDASGNIYVTGYIESPDMATSGAHQFVIDVPYDAFVMKLGTGGTITWATYYGGDDNDYAYDIAIDASLNVFVAGETYSCTGISTTGAHQESCNTQAFYDAFLVKFNSNGVRQFGTYYAGDGSDAFTSIEVDGSNNVLLTGVTDSPNNISSTGAHQTVISGDQEAFVVKFNNTGVRQWATYYGGSLEDYGKEVATDASGNVFVVGRTYSTASIATTGAHQTTQGGNQDGFVVKFNSSGVRQWGSYYGGTDDDQVSTVKVHTNGDVYLSGYTYSTTGISTTGSYQQTLAGTGSYDAFLTKLNSSGIRQWGTYFGGADGDEAFGIVLDGSGDGYLVGNTNSASGFASSGAYQTVYGGGTNGDGFISKFTASGSFSWATYFGGSGDEYVEQVALNGTALVITGSTSSSSGIASPGSFQGTFAGGTYDAFVAKFDVSNGPIITSFNPTSGLVGSTVTISGANFSASPGSNSVKFNGITAVVTASTTTSITTTVPVGAVTGPISVTVSGNTATSLSSFTVTTATTPTIASFNPASGPVGTSVTITGTNFSATPANNTVKFNGITATVTSSTTTSIVTSVPVGATTGILSVTVGSQTGISSSNFTVTTTAPTITSFNPTSGTVGTTVTISGTNFSTTPANNTVKFNGTTAVVTASTATDITTTVPTGATTGVVTVQVGSQTATSSSNFTVTTTPAPTITSFNPTSGSVGTSVTITGTNFSATPANNTVKFNSTTAVVTASTTTSITTSVPTGATTGAITVTVGGQTATSSTTFTVSTVTSEPTNQPTGLVFTNVKSTTYSFSFSAAAAGTVAPDGYIGIRRSGSAPTGVPVDGVTYIATDALGDGFVNFVGTETSFDQGGALPSTTYYLAIYSYKGSGTSINYKQVSPLTGSVTTLSGTDTTDPTIVNNTTTTSVAKGAPITITAQFTDAESGISEATIYYSAIEDAQDDYSNFTSAAMTKTTGDTYTFQIPGTVVKEMGVIYYFYAKNGATLYSYSSDYTVAIQLTADGLTIPFTSFGSDQTKYRIVSIPMQPTAATVDAVFADDLGAYDKKTWRLFRYQGTTTTELNGKSTLAVGNGYWLISNKNAKLDTGPGTTTTAAIFDPFKLSLSPGWNQIGNPYPYDIKWQAILDWNSNPTGITKLRTYNGTWNDGTELEKFSGGFVMNASSSAVTLEIPTYKDPSINGRKSDPRQMELRNPIDQMDWAITLNLEQGELINTLGGFGMNHAAADGYDAFDDFNLPRFANFIELSHQGKELHHFSYSKDVVPFDTNHTWEFSVETNSAEQVTMRWDNSYFGNNDKQLALWDVNLQRGFDMRSINQYSFNRLRSGNFKVFYGDEKYIHEKTAVSETVFHDVFPNPARNLVKISFSLPAQERLTIEVIDLLGRKISTVADENFAPGYHEVVWNTLDASGSEVTNGVYITQIKSVNREQQKRLIINK